MLGVVQRCRGDHRVLRPGLLLANSNWRQTPIYKSSGGVLPFNASGHRQASEGLFLQGESEGCRGCAERLYMMRAFGQCHRPGLVEVWRRAPASLRRNGQIIRPAE